MSENTAFTHYYRKKFYTQAGIHTDYLTNIELSFYYIMGIFIMDEQFVY